MFGAYTSFYAGRGRPLQSVGDERQRIDFYEFDNGWAAVALDEAKRRNALRVVEAKVRDQEVAGSNPVTPTHDS